MERFYLDMAFTDGNYYLTDILEIVVVAKESGNRYHRYVTIHYSVPKQVQLLTGITNRTIETRGVPFIRCEAMEAAIVIAHRGCA